MHRIDRIFGILYILLSCPKDNWLSYNPVYPVILSKKFLTPCPSLPLGQTCKTLYKITKRKENERCLYWPKDEEQHSASYTIFLADT